MKSSNQKQKEEYFGNEIGRKSAFESIEEQLYLSLMYSYKLIVGELDSFFKDHNTTGPQYEVLKILIQDEKKGIPIRKIAERMVSSNPDVTRIVDKLEKADLVERTRSSSDRRIINVKLTTEGIHQFNNIEKPLQILHKSQFKYLTKTDMKELLKLLFRARYPKQDKHF